MKVYVQAVTGAATAVNVVLGFIPDFVRVLNATDRSTLEYFKADTVNTNGVVRPADGGAVVKAANAAAGISVVAGDKDAEITEAETSDGNGTTYTQATGDSTYVQIGASCAVNGAADVLIVEAGMYDNP